MRRWSIVQAILTVALSLLLWAGVAVLCLMVGSTGDFGLPGWEQLPYRLEPALRYRLEYVLLASLVGAALASAGVVYQAILRNPLADPYLLGVSSGASLFAYLWQFTFTTTLITAFSTSAVGALSQQAFTFVGALMAIAVVFVLASSRGRLEPITLLLVGVIVNAVNGSIFLLVNAINKDRPASGGPLAFLVGGINTTLTAQQELAAAILIGLGLLALMYISGQLNVASLSEAEAQSLGVRVHRLRWLGLGISSLVTAAAVAISGPIGFVGLISPHLARLLVGPDVRRLLPVATAVGAVLLALADAASRYLAASGRAQTMLPVGVLTGLLGGPFFLMLLWRSRRAMGGRS